MVGRLAILPVRNSRVLRGVTNGRIADDDLVRVGKGGQLVDPAARAWTALVKLCGNDGLPLTYTWGGTYRSLDNQTQLFVGRYKPVSAARYWVTLPKRRRVWKGATSHGHSSTRWVKQKMSNGKYPATAAVPGTSNHGLGLAIDTAYDDDVSDGISPSDAKPIAVHRAWPKFKQHALDCGFSWEIKSEPWHIRYVAGDTTPPKVAAVEAAHGYEWIDGVGPRTTGSTAPIGFNTSTRSRSTGGAAPDSSASSGSAAPQSTWTEDLVNNLTTLRLGTDGDDVRRLQALLGAAEIECDIDGHFGPNTDTAVRKYQTSVSVLVDGVVGRITWSKLLGA